MDFQRMNPYLLHGQTEYQDKEVPVLGSYKWASLEMGQSPGNGSGSIQEDFSPRHVPHQSLMPYDSTIPSNDLQYPASDTHSFPAANGPYVFGSHGPHQGYASYPRPQHRYPDPIDNHLGNNTHPGSGRTENLEYSACPQPEHNLYCEAGFHYGSPPCQLYISGRGDLVPVNVAGDLYSQVPSEHPFDVLRSSSFPLSAMHLDPFTNEVGDLGLLSSVPMQRDKKLGKPHSPDGYSGSTRQMCLGQSGTSGNINATGFGSDLMSQSMFQKGITPPGSHSVHKVNLVFGELALPHRPI